MTKNSFVNNEFYKPCIFMPANGEDAHQFYLRGDKYKIMVYCNKNEIWSYAVIGGIYCVKNGSSELFFDNKKEFSEWFKPVPAGDAIVNNCIKFKKEDKNDS